MMKHGFTHGLRLSEAKARRDLPGCAGIYVLLRPDPLVEGGWHALYVGRTVCLSSRVRNSHHVLEDLRRDPDVFLLLHPLPKATERELESFERETIRNLRPSLNRTN